MKMRVQAQHLQPGDIVGSGERVGHIILNSIHWSSSKVYVHLINDKGQRGVHWGRYTEIPVERAEKVKI